MEIKITENRYHLDLNRLMVLGKRLNNEKRNFLFISKVLGKHLEIEPNICRATGFLLASLRYGRTPQTGALIDALYNPQGHRLSISKSMEQPYETNERICVLGFAETATGLGMAVSSAIKGSYYVHTTREDIVDLANFIQFEEEHSHATQHRCFPKESSWIKDAERLILVDDELTTGKSLLNMIEELVKVTSIKKFTMLTILDWRTSEHERWVREACERHQIEIEIQALMRGEVEVNDQTLYQDNGTPTLNEVTDVIPLETLPRTLYTTKQGSVDYYRASGRFGVSHEEILKLEEYCQTAADKIQMLLPADAERLLVLGHGEDIYIPSRVAAHLKGIVSFKSTTRSPIYVSEQKDYPIQQKHCFEDEGVTYYFYHRDQLETRYDQVIFITEKNVNIRFTDRQLTVRL